MLINMALYLHGMCFANIVVIITNLTVVTMHHNKDTQKEIMVLEAIVLTFWLLIFAVSYLLAKVTV
jgi:hypothetical protein